MPALPRKTQKIFGSSLVPSGNVAVWGSLAAGAPAYSGDLATIQSASWLTGLNNALVGNRSPAQEDLNGLFLTITQQLAYLLSSGIPEWDTGTTYYVGQFVRVAGALYVSTTNNNTGNVVTDTNNWIPYARSIRGPAVCGAWVSFDGINESPTGYARLQSAYNVTNVTKNGNGSYTVNFATPFDTANYIFSGSCGSENGTAYGAGDNGVVVGNISGQGLATRSPTACRIFTINPNTLATVQSGCVNVMFFGNAN